MRSSPIWRLVPGQRLVHRCHDGECVLFNDLTGDTHLLDETAIALLALLRAAPRPAAGLLAAFITDPDEAGAASASADESAGLDELLADLAALRLVEEAPC